MCQEVLNSASFLQLPCSFERRGTPLLCPFVHGSSLGQVRLEEDEEAEGRVDRAAEGGPGRASHPPQRPGWKSAIEGERKRVGGNLFVESVVFLGVFIESVVFLCVFIESVVF